MSTSSTAKTPALHVVISDFTLTNRLFRGCPPSYSAAYSAGYSAGFRAHSAGTKSQQHAHI